MLITFGVGVCLEQLVPVAHIQLGRLRKLVGGLLKEAERETSSSLRQL